MNYRLWKEGDSTSKFLIKDLLTSIPQPAFNGAYSVGCALEELSGGK